MPMVRIFRSRHPLATLGKVAAASMKRAPSIQPLLLCAINIEILIKDSTTNRAVFLDNQVFGIFIAQKSDVYENNAKSCADSHPILRFATAATTIEALRKHN